MPPHFAIPTVHANVQCTVGLNIAAPTTYRATSNFYCTSPPFVYMNTFLTKIRLGLPGCSRATMPFESWLSEPFRGFGIWSFPRPALGKDFIVSPCPPFNSCGLPDGYLPTTGGSPAACRKLAYRNRPDLHPSPPISQPRTVMTSSRKMLKSSQVGELRIRRSHVTICGRRRLWMFREPSQLRYEAKTCQIDVNRHNPGNHRNSHL
jgi:hypothetical protein